MSLATNLAQIPNITVNRIPRATATGFVDSAIFDNGTHIGIGTNSPANYFTTTVTIDGASSQGIMFRAGGVDRGFIYQDGSFIQIGSNAGGVIIKSNDTERIRITSGGNVLIGNSSGDARLYVKSSVANSYSPSTYIGANANIRLETGGTPAQNITTGISMGVGGAAEAYIGAVQNSSSYADIAFQTYNGNYAERMRIRSNGNRTFNGPGGQDQMFSNYARTGNGEYIDIDTESGGGNFQGILIAQNNYAYNAGYRTQGIYAIVGRGTTISVTTITSVNGPTGSSALSITCPSTGIIRITNVGLYGDISASWRGFV